MPGPLDGRAALVTGAGNGIGRACAMALAAHGASVVVNDLGTDEFGKGTSAAADATVADIRAAGGVAVANHDSVADSGGCAAAVATAVDAFGQLDIVVGCAGALLEGSLQATDEEYQRFLNLFLSQKFWLARAAVPAMAERGWGRLITTTSFGATGLLGKPIFAGAMGGVISMTKAIAHEYRGTGVTANCLAPGAATRLHTLSRARFEELHAGGLISDEQWDSYVNTPPPEYVAPIVVWLCTDRAAGVTGEVFHASGGTVGRWSSYREEQAIHRGDHRANPPWTIEELDLVVPSVFFRG
ncbi:MAG TPA: SDR family oxidoreductase [Acidimicrobiales bacterium]|jgi:NAD(P)-dependent dehydrogenase (short-subunit alcohol dehydrogenase family)|nr:SDR family oxidoreductase [Acidimicrobiales bacterium]